MQSDSPRAVLAIFVGGGSRRMGGRPKGRLPAPEAGEPIVEALVRRGRDAGLEPILVGDAGAYADLAPGVPRIADSPRGVGPLGGLAAALAYAGERPLVTVACDMPYVDAAVLGRVRDACGEGAVVAPRREAGPWEPMLACWDSPRVRPVLEEALAAGERSLQGLLRRLSPAPLPLDDAIRRALEDWDRPEDVR